MKVAIDPDKCMGHGVCYTLAPNVYADDDNGFGKVIGDGVVSDDEADAARSGAANCPEVAITVAD
jgi:ferredoxin